MSHHHALRRDLAELRRRIEELYAELKRKDEAHPGVDSIETDARANPAGDRMVADEENARILPGTNSGA
jgi:hypothetical protein